ncbi:DUF2332 domain-containing protein [halophilic archaeon]|nr:DUF2332 domain-containing protein [halophilic archaeon]
MLADSFRNFADWAVGTSPLYERLERGVADDPDLLALAETVPEGRSPPHLLLGSVHSLLLGGADHELAAFYDTVTESPLDPRESDPLPAFRDFCAAYEDEICPLLRTRRTQTNAVRRCAALLPAFAHVSAEAGGEPLAIVELGPSAGLNLCWDRYRYEYAATGEYGPIPADWPVGDAGRPAGCGSDSPVRVEADVVGERAPPLPDELPPVASRVGVDLHPLDVTDADDVRWLRALVWPEHATRHRLLRSAIAVAREDPPELRQGDAVEALPSVLDGIPASRPVCLFDTQMRYQLDEERDAELRETVAAAAADRELHWLSGHAAAERDNALVLEWFDGERSQSLAAYEQHGKWVEWLV